MELMDVFNKYDTSINAQCIRNERMFEDICKEREIKFEPKE